MHNHMFKVGLLLALVAPSAAAVPTLSYTAVDLGTKVGFTVSINWDDALTASGFFQLDAAGTNGSTIQQQNATVAQIVINTEADANLFGSLDPAYSKAMDSWWFVGATTPFSNGTPPYNGVAAGSGNVGSNLYQASFGTAPATPVSGSTNVLYLVLDKVDGAANGRIDGSIARNGVDYLISNFPLEFIGGTTTLSVDPNPLDFGSVRMGTTAWLPLTATNSGSAGGLTGDFGGASGEFGPGGGQSFGPLGAGASAQRHYTYAPTDRGSDSSLVTVSSDATVGNPNATVSLSGTGVGPDYDASVSPGGTLSLDISLTAPTSQALTVSNVTTDDNGGTAALTNLTLVDVAVSGADAASFGVGGISDGQVLGKGQAALGSVTLGPSRNYRPRTATLTVATDEGAPLGGNGADYSYQVIAAPQTPGIWQALSGGAWEGADNWSLDNSPAAGDTARFSLEGDYTVSLAGNRSQAGLIVTNDDVQLDLNAHSLSLTGDLLVGDLPTSLGRLAIQDGIVSATRLQVGVLATADGRLDVANGAALQTGGAYVGGSPTSAGGTGVLAIAAGGSFATTGAVKVWPEGTLLVDGAAAATAGLELAGGTLSGGGAVTSTIFNSGTVDPAGDLDIGGVYAQSPSGVLAIELDAADHDALHVSGIAVLAGELEIVFADGFEPDYGDVFQVLTFGTRSGQFQAITGTEFEPGRTMLPVYSATALTLYAITPGDANGDGYVTPADYTIWADNFGLGPGATILDGDFNLDGFVNGADYTLWADNYTGLPDGVTKAVPEPASSCLAVALIALMPLRCICRRMWPC